MKGLPIFVSLQNMTPQRDQFVRYRKSWLFSAFVDGMTTGVTLVGTVGTIMGFGENCCVSFFHLY